MHILILFFDFCYIKKNKMERKVANLIENVIKLRIDSIIEKGNLGIEIGDKIKSINKDIENEIKIKSKKRVKNDIPKGEKRMNLYTLYIKDVTNIIKENPNLNYLQNNIVNRIKKCKDKKRNEQFKEFSNIWNELPDETKNKYKKLCQNKDFTNIKYDEIIGKISTPKMPRKKKSKDNI